MLTSLGHLATLSLLSLSSAHPASPPTEVLVELERRAGLTPYQPVTTSCPSGPLVRSADALNTQETEYIAARRKKTDEALAQWLAKQGSFSTETQPSIALTSSGGGLRALLETAGVVQAFDARESDGGVGGIYQALTYHSGLSGGAWFLSSQAGNSWPTVSYLRDELWELAFMNTLLLPANLLSLKGLTEYVAITSQLLNKQGAGYEVTLVDAYGRLLSYQLLKGFSGGVGKRISDLDSLSNLTDHNVPYPIITALGAQSSCNLPTNATQYEFTPHEFGSWDDGVSAFTPVEFLGSKLNNGAPAKKNKCVKQYDNLGYVLATSSNIFPALCEVPEPENATSADLANAMEGMISLAHKPVFSDLFALYPNPFFNRSESAVVAQDEDLSLADGGFSNQNNPIWPFLQPERNVDVLLVNDNSGDTDDNFPDGSQLRQTYESAQAAGLTKMPFIPTTDVFTSQNLTKRAQFFGCEEEGTVFVVWLPNVEYTFDSGQSTARLSYFVGDTDDMIENGNAIATQGGEEGWPFCLACAVKSADGDALPEGCGKCFDKYCYKRDGGAS